jgi:hypothetical protein
VNVPGHLYKVIACICIASCQAVECAEVAPQRFHVSLPSNVIFDVATTGAAKEAAKNMERCARAKSGEANAHLGPTATREFSFHCSPNVPTLHDLAYKRAPRCGDGIIVGWRAEKDLPDGPSFIARANKLADSRQLFGCEGPECLVVVVTPPPQPAPRDLTLLSVGRVVIVANLAGPPQFCSPIASIEGQARFVMSALGEQSMGCAQGFPDFDSTFPGRAKDKPAVVDLVKSVLGRAPFNMEVEERDEVVYGISRFVSSKVLDGWREWIQLRVDLRGVGDDLGATISTNILLSKQNVSDVESWNPAPRALDDAYIRALRKAFEARGARTTSRRQ